ncbi:multiple coagulation factor deficiency protein 2 homolog [Centruroides vittatus]|uniref:multiple coagulation factor deficiency protein 2 homolog n=1 Tax=Centruroides vittatus TaxID=120091 RepID=UPI003510213F
MRRLYKEYLFIIIIFQIVTIKINGHVNIHQQKHHYNVKQHQHQGSGSLGMPSTPNEKDGTLIRDKARIQDKEHIKDHLEGIVDEPDISHMSEEELQFHYFKMHDNDKNNKLDGCELVKSLIHWHLEENKQSGNNPATPKIFSDHELATMIDPILDMDDQNKDGFIDYPEFIAAQQSRSN